MELNNLSPKKVTELENELTTLSKSVNSTACWKELGADDAELVLGFESWKPSIWATIGLLSSEMRPPADYFLSPEIVGQTFPAQSLTRTEDGFLCGWVPCR